jgi:hypothetical protein
MEALSMLKRRIERLDHGRAKRPTVPEKRGAGYFFVDTCKEVFKHPKNAEISFFRPMKISFPLFA